jgi:DNA-binding PadR family transcriptional regulator
MKKRDTSRADELLPLPPAVFHILLSLAEGERHGYALKREIVQRTSGSLAMGPGVLYGTIARMIDQGLSEDSADRPDPHLDDERRRYYKLTAFGRKVAQAEAARLRDLVALAAARFGGRQPA